MSKFISPVEKHYFRDNLYENILLKLQEKGIDTAKVSRKDISGVDEFHVRGAEVSIELAKEAGFNKDITILDVGCGIGGPCRMIADEYGCKVTGIDLTDEFIRTAKLLSKLVGLQDLNEFIASDATDMPFESNSFDIVWTQHVQMNIENKEKLYSEISRVLKKGGRFIYYDILSKGNGPIHFPVPWADEQLLSFLITSEELKCMLTKNGLTEVSIKDQTQQAIKYFKETFEKMSKEGPPAVGLSLLMTDSAQEKFKNILKNILEDKIELQSGIYRS